MDPGTLSGISKQNFKQLRMSGKELLRNGIYMHSISHITPHIFHRLTLLLLIWFGVHCRHKHRALRSLLPLYVGFYFTFYHNTLLFYTIKNNVPPQVEKPLKSAWSKVKKNQGPKRPYSPYFMDCYSTMLVATIAFGHIMNTCNAYFSLGLLNFAVPVLKIFFTKSWLTYQNFRVLQF